MDQAALRQRAHVRELAGPGALALGQRRPQQHVEGKGHDRARGAAALAHDGGPADHVDAQVLPARPGLAVEVLGVVVVDRDAALAGVGIPASEAPQEPQRLVVQVLGLVDEDVIE